MSNLHTVTVKAREGFPAQVTFNCAGDDTASCHNYPACNCEVWTDGHEHPRVAHGECWMASWFQRGEGAVEYDGDDDANEDGWPTKSRTGPVNVDYEDEYLIWSWAT